MLLLILNSIQALEYEELKAAMESSNPELQASLYQLNASQTGRKELFGEENSLK
jgi:hypothetical protein